jgi:hypothetical protein
VQEHHGNGEHPESLERRRQVLVWRSLAALVVAGAAVGLVRLVVDLLGDAPARSLAYQVVLLVVARAPVATAERSKLSSGRSGPRSICPR